MNERAAAGGNRQQQVVQRSCRDFSKPSTDQARARLRRVPVCKAEQ